MKYDVFISYRRDLSKEIARLIKSELSQRRLSVFIDFDELKDGVFDKRIMDAIESAPVFLIVLSKGSLDRCVNEDDWVRKEILYADRTKKHIIPVEIDKSFRNIPDYVPGEIRNIVGQHQFSQIDTETLLQASIDKLVNDRIAPIVHSSYKKDDMAFLKIRTDIACKLYIDKVESGELLPGNLNKIPLNSGEYELRFESRSNPIDSIVDAKYKMEDYDRIYDVHLLPIQEKRIRDEAERRRIEKEQERRRLEVLRKEEERKKTEQEAKERWQEEQEEKREKQKLNRMALPYRIASIVASIVGLILLINKKEDWGDSFYLFFEYFLFYFPFIVTLGLTVLICVKCATWIDYGDKRYVVFSLIGVFLGIIPYLFDNWNDNVFIYFFSFGIFGIPAIKSLLD